MPLIEELCAEHRRLEEQTADLLKIVSASIPDPAAVAALRWRMAQALTDHCAREDHAVYDWLIASGDATGTSVAWRYRQDHGQLSESFGKYVADWPVARIAREWDAFRVETEAVAIMLASRILLEERVLYAHLRRVRMRRAA